MSKTYTLDNHRKLGSEEVIRKGDLYLELSNGAVKPCHYSIGRQQSDFHHYMTQYEFYRRRHTKKPAATAKPKNITVTSKPVTATAKPSQPQRFPLVKFKYPSTKRWGAPAERLVKVISLDAVYLLGLEVIDDKHYFKKFLVSKVIDGIRLVTY